MSEKPKKINVDKVLKALKACYNHADHANCPYDYRQYDCQEFLLRDAITAIEQLRKEQEGE